MNLDEIRNEVIGIVQDQSFDPDQVTGYINEALRRCAGMVDIPEHKRVATVLTATDKAYISLADQIDHFGGRVRRAKCDGADLRIYESLDQLMDDYDMDEEGDLAGVALEGRTLWYQKIPETATSILLLCFVNPEPLSRSNPEATWMPEHLHRDILVNGAASYIWDQIEDEDSNKPMTKDYFKKAFGTHNTSGVMQLRAWIARERSSIGYSCWRY